jgi:hypothetical protein
MISHDGVADAYPRFALPHALAVDKDEEFATDRS